MNPRNPRFASARLGLAAAVLVFVPAGAAPIQRFDFGTAAAAAPGCTPVDAGTTFSRERGYGFEPGAAVRIVDREGADLRRRDFATADAPFAFSVVVPREGNFRVTVELGDAAGDSMTTIRAEVRRLMVENAGTRPRDFRVHRFIVNTRTPRIDDHRTVRLKDREKTSEARAWDDCLTLEFSGPRPAVCALEIEPADDVPTLYLLGDSTVSDQATEPFAGWGQMLPRFLTDDIAVANHAESGESFVTAFAEGRVDKVVSLLRPGDFVMMQFGHNDQKATGPGTGARLDYTQAMGRCIDLVREKRAVPILVTSMHRLGFDSAGRVADTLGDFPRAMREVAAGRHVALIDLHAMSGTLLEALGPADSTTLFVPGDTTHHSAPGAYLLARCVLTGIRSARLPLADAIGPGITDLDLARPEWPADVPRAPVPAAPSAAGSGGS